MKYSSRFLDDEYKWVNLNKISQIWRSLSKVSQLHVTLLSYLSTHHSERVNYCSLVYYKNPCTTIPSYITVKEII